MHPVRHLQCAAAWADVFEGRLAFPTGRAATCTLGSATCARVCKRTANGSFIVRTILELVRGPYVRKSLARSWATFHKLRSGHLDVQLGLHASIMYTSGAALGYTSQ